MLRKSSVQINSTKIIIVAFLVANHARNVINMAVCSVLLPQLYKEVVVWDVKMVNISIKSVDNVQKTA